MSNTTLLKKILQSRILISYLGESQQFAWWESNFLSPVGLQFSEINFPRSAFSAACNSAAEAARRLHDTRIGRGSVLHLFRFSPPMEQDLHSKLLVLPKEEISPLIMDKETALKKLSELAKPANHQAEGPVQVAQFKGEIHQDDLTAMAAYYLNAFQNNLKCFPYIQL